MDACSVTVGLVVTKKIICIKFHVCFLFCPLYCQAVFPHVLLKGEPGNVACHAFHEP